MKKLNWSWTQSALEDTDRNCQTEMEIMGCLLKVKISSAPKFQKSSKKETTAETISPDSCYNYDVKASPSDGIVLPLTIWINKSF